MASTALTEPSRKWSVGVFRHYWKAPCAPRATPVTADVVGFWRRPIFARVATEIGCGETRAQIRAGQRKAGT